MPPCADHHPIRSLRLLRRDSEFRFGHFLQPTEDGGCAVGGFAETTAHDRGEGSGGFSAAAAADGGLFARGFVFLTATDRGGEGAPGEVVRAAGARAPAGGRPEQRGEANVALGWERRREGGDGVSVLARVGRACVAGSTGCMGGR